MLQTWMRKYGIFLGIGLLILVVVLIVILSKTNTNSNEKETMGTEVQESVSQGIETSNAKESEETEMLAVWVPYLSLNMSGEEQGEAAFQKKFDQIVQDAKEHKMNTLIVQVRPFADAFYPSALYPWSGYLTGTQGTDPGYDPLAYMVQATHDAGMQFHAWVNPLRIKANGVPEQMADSNPYSLWKEDSSKQDWCLTWDETDGIYLNPGIPEVREYIAQGVGEIVKNYDVDGIQFDDYFYPTESAEFDQETYQKYCDGVEEVKTVLSQSEWRKANISSLVSLVYSTVKQEKENVVFGISPQGNIENNESIGADVTAWCSTAGYVDYICPQLYYNFENPHLPFDTAANQWKELVTNSEIELYFGLGLYKASSDADEGTWKEADDILAQEIQLGRKIGCDGFMFYSYEQLNSETAQKEIENVMKVL